MPNQSNFQAASELSCRGRGLLARQGAYRGRCLHGRCLVQRKGQLLAGQLLKEAAWAGRCLKGRCLKGQLGQVLAGQVLKEAGA